MHVFCKIGADLHAQSVISNKISASELSRKLIKSALLVGSSQSSNDEEKKKQVPCCCKTLFRPCYAHVGGPTVLYDNFISYSTP